MLVATTNLSKVSWNTPRGVAKFAAVSAGFGIRREDGKLLSRDGESPCSWGTKRVVESMLPYAADFENHVWIEVRAN